LTLWTHYSEEIDPIGRKPAEVLCRIGGERIREQGKVISRYSAGHKKDTMVGALLSEELNGQANEIVSIARYQTAPLAGSPLQLLPIRPSES